MADGATGGVIEGRHTLCGSMESRTEKGAAGGETKRLDLGGDVAARRRESRHAPRPAVLSGGQAYLGEEDQTESSRGQEEEDGGGRGGGGGADEGGDTPHQEAWHRLQGWYKATVYRPPPPARATLRRVMAEREKLYSRVPPRETPSRSQSHRSQWRTAFPRKRKSSGRSNACKTTAPGDRQ